MCLTHTQSENDELKICCGIKRISFCANIIQHLRINGIVKMSSQRRLIKYWCNRKTTYRANAPGRFQQINRMDAMRKNTGYAGRK